jgi:hypothetical protein
MGTLHMVADLLHLPNVKAVTAAWGAFPAPKVFSTVDGLETFSSQFIIRWKDRHFMHHQKEITPLVAANLKGPYNRRNVYGAVLAYGPILSQNKDLCPLYESILTYAISHKCTFLEELGIDRSTIKGEIIIEVVPANGKKLPHLQLTKTLPISDRHNEQ